MQTLFTLAQQLQSSAITVEEFRIGCITSIERMSVDDLLGLAMLINESDIEEIMSELTN